MGVIEEVKQKTDIVEVVSQYASLKKAGRNLTALCPFHSEKHPSFFVYPEQQSWHCFGACNTGGDVLSFVMKKEGITFGEALRLLAQRAGVIIPSRPEAAGKQEERDELYQINEAAVQYFHNALINSSAGEKARSYVASRGFTAKTTTDFQLGFSLNNWEALKQHLLERDYTEDKLLAAGLILTGDDGKTHDRFRNRLMFPILDIRGHTIGFGARALDDSMPKYLNSPQTETFDKSATLYGLNLATKAIRQQDAAVIVEGYIDVITAHQNGITNVVASMGTAITETQVKALRKLSKNLILAFDADIAGTEANLKSGEVVTQPTSEDLAPQYDISLNISEPSLNEADVLKLRKVGTQIINREALNIDVRIIKLPEGKDPDDLIKEDVNTWQQLVTSAVPIVDYTFNIVAAQLDLTTAKDKSLVAERLLPVIAEIKDPVRQAHYLQKLARLVSVSERTIETALSRMVSAPYGRKALAKPPETIIHTVQSFASSPLEAHLLALLLQHPEFKASSGDVSPEYFQSSENREIFLTWRQVDNLPSLKDKLEPTLHEYLDSLLSKDLLSTQVEQRFADYVRSLRLRYLRNLEARKAEILALEAESGGPGADMAKLEEQGIDTSTQIRELFGQKYRRRSELRR